MIATRHIFSHAHSRAHNSGQAPGDICLSASRRRICRESCHAITATERSRVPAPRSPSEVRSRSPCRWRTICRRRFARFPGVSLKAGQQCRRMHGEASRAARAIDIHYCVAISFFHFHLAYGHRRVRRFSLGAAPSPPSFRRVSHGDCCFQAAWGWQLFALILCHY